MFQYFPNQLICTSIKGIIALPLQRRILVLLPNTRNGFKYTVSEEIAIATLGFGKCMCFSVKFFNFYWPVEARQAYFSCKLCGYSHRTYHITNRITEIYIKWRVPPVEPVEQHGEFHEAATVRTPDTCSPCLLIPYPAERKRGENSELLSNFRLNKAKNSIDGSNNEKKWTKLYK